jgi:transposase-like protein
MYEKRMSPPNRQDVPQIFKELGIHRSTPYKWRSNWRLQGEVVPASEKDPESWSAADKFTVVFETAGFNDTELSRYCRVRGLFLEQVDRWRKTAQDQREIKQLKKELQCKEKDMAEIAAL